MKPVALLGVVLKLQITEGSSASHLRPNLFSLLKILGFEALQDHAIGTLYLAFCLWVRHY